MSENQYDRLNCAECGADVGVLESPENNPLGTDGADIVVADSGHGGAARVLCSMCADEKMGDAYA